LFIRKKGNEANGRDRAYAHQEIQKILGFCDQRIRTSFLLLTSNGIRIGALQTLKVGELEKIDDMYKIKVYSGDKEEYFTFCTPECAKEIDSYLEFRTKPEDCSICRTLDDSLRLVEGCILVMSKLHKISRQMILLDSSG
jgi:hypothetical protein